MPCKYISGCTHLHLVDTLVFVLKSEEAGRLKQHRQLPSTGLHRIRGQISVLILARENIRVKLLNSQATTQLQQFLNCCTLTHSSDPSAEITYELAL